MNFIYITLVINGVMLLIDFSITSGTNSLIYAYVYRRAYSILAWISLLTCLGSIIIAFKSPYLIPGWVWFVIIPLTIRWIKRLFTK